MNEHRVRVLAAGVAGLVLLAGCDRSPVSPPDAPAPSAEVATAPGQLFLYGLGGLTRSHPQSPCSTTPYREFDFWVGTWDVFVPSGAQAGTNHVKSLLDGCLVEENWTGSGGGRGRSMNIYDAATGEWSQYWMDQFSLHLRLSGGLVGSVMTLQGDRIGFTPGGPIPIIDRIRWTPQAGEVNQFWDISIDDGQSFPIVAFNGQYVSNPNINPAPPLQQQFCTSAQYQELDFLIGDWSVDAENGPHLGYSSVISDMEGCMLEEDFATDGTYASQSFFGWDFRTGEWYRVHVDTEGVKLLLSGGLQGASMVLSGRRPTAGGDDLYVRVTLTPEGANHVVQTWEISRDGSTWKARSAVTFTRQ